ncbi:unnamed protein product [Adineta steineri]|uniref:Endonuclease/exonuclease/phosphatase domain-containing protein n=1 Tax=Adineta steineri TaxID=433720 RepID=A0A814S157_9BILA|nr:unnamed protein product [Adineta steineri]CAF1141744.1 unnamed protein product [Adineta steineri]
MAHSIPPAPDLSLFFNRFSQEELHQIGLALIQRSQISSSSSDKQQHVINPGVSQHISRTQPIDNRPLIDTVTSIPSPSFPPIMNHQQIQQQPIVSKVCPHMEKECTPVSSSTTRRPASDSFDNVGGSSSYNNNKKQKNNDDNQSSYVQAEPQQPTLRPPSPLSTHTRQLSFNMNILKRAVSNNLPCFFITFDQSIEINNIPSSIQVAIMLKKLFSNSQLHIKDLSLCTQAGERRFKFAVSDKADFLTLFNWTWPDNIENKKVEIAKPRYLPDCYSLVVRYVPTEVNYEIARSEIIKSISSAVSFSSINYQQRRRPSYDIRFSVHNLEQYQTALQLGRIAIGQHFLPLTNYHTSYRMTYCTACWKIGHMRSQCQFPVCCGKCLVPYTNGVKHICQDNALRCAQCGENHFSLEAICPIVKKYKDELKLAVDNALSTGVIKRPPLVDNLPRPFQLHHKEFPTLHKEQTVSRTAWHTTDKDISFSSSNNDMTELIMPNKYSSSLNVHAQSFFPSSSDHLSSSIKSPFENALSKLDSWKFPFKTQKRIVPILSDWFSSSTLNNVLSHWENNPCPSRNKFTPVNILTYNVEGWGTRALEAIDLIYKVDSPICVFTEVGELWDTIKVPHFSSFHQKGTNHSGGVMILIGKHLKATRIDTDIENTVIVDVFGLSEQIRIIGIYWPQGQKRNLNDISPFLIKGTLLIGDFNATSDVWCSPYTDPRGTTLMKWIEDTDLAFIPTNHHSSKRSNRHIDLPFTNLNRADCETIFFGTSDHWPLVVRSPDIVG